MCRLFFVGVLDLGLYSASMLFQTTVRVFVAVRLLFRNSCPCWPQKYVLPAEYQQAGRTLPWRQRYGLRRWGSRKGLSRICYRTPFVHQVMTGTRSDDYAHEFLKQVLPHWWTPRRALIVCGIVCSGRQWLV